MTDTHVHAHAYDRAFKVGIAVNVLYVLIEAGCGFAFNSVALISDAGHNMSDVLALGLAWGATFLSHSRPTERRTYGMKRATVLASLVSAVMLCVALGAVIWESLARLAEPASTNGRTIILVAGAGTQRRQPGIRFYALPHHDSQHPRGPDGQAGGLLQRALPGPADDRQADG